MSSYSGESTTIFHLDKSKAKLFPSSRNTNKFLSWVHSFHIYLSIRLRCLTSELSISFFFRFLFLIRISNFQRRKKNDSDRENISVCVTQFVGHSLLWVSPMNWNWCLRPFLRLGFEKSFRTKHSYKWMPLDRNPKMSLESYKIAT